MKYQIVIKLLKNWMHSRKGVSIEIELVSLLYSFGSMHSREGVSIEMASAASQALQKMHSREGVSIEILMQSSIIALLAMHSRKGVSIEIT